MGKSADTAQPNSVASGLGEAEKQGNCRSVALPKSPAQTVCFAPDHEGMRIDASGVLCNNSKGSTQLRKVLLGHL